MVRGRVKGVLRHLGLLSTARRVQGEIDTLRSLPSNVPWWYRGARDGLPLPPTRLVRLATGTSSTGWYLASGAAATESIQAALAARDVEVERVSSVLDFGCGCGRVLRHWHRLPGRLSGTDYNPALVEWCTRHLGFAEFQLNGLAPPLDYPDEAFDLVYALSVFTHVPAALQEPWMDEMSRILTPGGHLVISTHGEAYLDALDEMEQRAFRAGRLVVRNEDESGTNRCGVYFPEAYVRGTLARRLALIDFIPEGAKGNPRQDLILLRKPFSTSTRPAAGRSASRVGAR